MATRFYTTCRACGRDKPSTATSLCNPCQRSKPHPFRIHCSRCRAAKPATTSTYCTECARVKRAERAAKNGSRVYATCCICKQSKKPNHSSRCSPCKRALFQIYYAMRPGLFKAQDHRRRARKLASAGHFTQADWDAIVTRQDGRCIDCGAQTKLTIGHLIPLSRGGSNMTHNIVGQCDHCNKTQATRIHPHAKFTIFDQAAICLSSH